MPEVIGAGSTDPEHPPRPASSPRGARAAMIAPLPLTPRRTVRAAEYASGARIALVFGLEDMPQTAQVPPAARPRPQPQPPSRPPQRRAPAAPGAR